MQVRIEDVSPVEKKLIVEVPWDTVNTKLGDAYRELSKNVRLKGFRQGKVPRSVLQRMYGKHVHNEVALQLIRESFLTATSEHNLEAVSEPRVETAPDIKQGEPFAFEAIVEVKGTVEPKDYFGMELTRRPLKVTEADVDGAIDSLRRDHTELRPIEGRDLTARTDVVTVTIKGTIGEHAIDRSGVHVDLTDTARDPLPGLIEALTGIPINAENHEIHLTLPEDYPDTSVAGKHAHLTITVEDARRKEIPELDDELAKDLERGETVADLRASVRGDLEKQKQAEIDRELRETAIKELVKRNQIPVASALVERGVEYRFNQLQAMLGLPPDRERANRLPEDLREKMRPAALEEIRGQLLLEAIAEKENIEVSEEDIDQQIAKLAESRDQSAARMRAELQRDGRLDNMRYQLRQEKALDLLISRAVVTEAEPKEEPAAEGGQGGQGGQGGETSAAQAPGQPGESP